MRVTLLQPQEEAAYEQLNRSTDQGLLYGSLKYRRFLQDITGAQPAYFAAWDQQQLIGALPSFIYAADTGAVINSLPFFGSSPGIIIAPNQDTSSVTKSLLEALHNEAKARHAISTTVITNPLFRQDENVARYAHASATDSRIGQFTCLPDDAAKLMDCFHSKTRNMIRKAHKSGFTVGHDHSLEMLQQLAALHTENLKAIGGLPKPWSVFEAIRENFVYDQDYRVYYARKDGELAAALLVFFYHRTAEYFTPAIRESYRSEQPLSLLIETAMHEACARQMLYWNWGGTWLSQTGVYHFKSRWGTTDYPYHYYIREYPEHGTFRTLAKETIVERYPYFYTIPFSELQGTAA